MLQLQLFIEGKQVELYKDESITLTQSIQDIKDISKIFTDFTRTFNVPASKNNNKIFKHFYNFHIKTYNEKTGDFEPYDARKKKGAELFLNYKPFKEGKIKFEGVSLKNNEPHSYKLTFFGNIVSLKDILGEDKLANLSQLDLFNFEYTDANISSYMSNGLDVTFFGGTIDEAIIFPLITHTSRIIFDKTKTNDVANKIYNINTTAGTSTSYGLPKSELKPAIRLYAIIKAIENQPGYNLKFSDDFFSQINFDFYNLYLWLHNKEGGLFQDQEAQYQITGFSDIIGHKGEITGVTDKTFVNTYNENTSERVLRVTVRPSGTAAYNLVIKKDGEDFKRFDNLAGTTTNGIISSSFKNKDHNILIPNGTFTYFIESIAVSTYSVDFSIEVKKNGFLTTDFQITVRNATASAGANKDVTIASILPDIKLIDFITGLFKMFNLTAFQKTDGTLIVQPLDDFYNASTQIWDITKHLDKNEKVVEGILPFKEIIFRYTGNDSFLAKNHKELSGKEWGRLDYADDKYDGNLYKIELPFEHFKFEHLYITNNDVIQTTTNSEGNEQKSNSQVQYGYSVNKDQEPYLGEPLIFYATKSISNISVLTLDLGTRETVVGTYIPLNTNGILNIFGSNEYQNLNFNAEYDEYSRQVNTKTLFKTYYKDYVQDMFDKRKRLSTVKAYLPIEITIKLNLADKIIVFDDVFRINKISTNFETNLSTIELNNIFVEPNFSTLLAVAKNCITVDTTNYSADNISLKASAGCDIDFPLPDINTPIPDGFGSDYTDNDSPVDGGFVAITAPKIKELEAEDILPSTSTSVNFGYQVLETGTFFGVKRTIYEYGFFYATNKSLLQKNSLLPNVSKGVPALLLTSGVTHIPIGKISSNNTPFFTGVNYIPSYPVTPVLPKNIYYTKSNLSQVDTYFYVFYATTGDYQYNSATNEVDTIQRADAISEIESVINVQPFNVPYNNASGENLIGIGGTSGYIGASNIIGNFQFQLIFTAFPPYGGEDLGAGNGYNTPSGAASDRGFVLTSSGSFDPNTIEGEFKKIIIWFTDEANPIVDTYYSISHTWKTINQNLSNANKFTMTNTSGAQIKYMIISGYLRIFIKGGTVTGDYNTLISLSPTGHDLQSTS